MNNKLFYGIFLVIFSVFMRFLYAEYQPQPILNADSYGYYGLGQKIADHPAISTIVNQYRVPVYPSILGGFALLYNKVDIPLDAVAFQPVLIQLTSLQSALSVAGIGLVYMLLLLVSVPAFWALFISVVLSMNVYMYPLERAVMTDSLAGTFLIGLTYLLVRLIQKPTTRGYAIFGFFSVVSWLLRPNLLLVPLLSLPLLLFVKTNRKYVLTNILVLGISLLLPIIFVQLNSRYHGYAGISQATEIALLGRILEFDVPVEAGKRFRTYYDAVSDFRKRDGEPSPFRFIDTYMPLAYVDTRLMTELQQFDRTVITANFPSYVVNVVSYIPYIFSDDSPFQSIHTKPNDGLAGFFVFLWQVSRGLWQLGYLVFFLWPVSVWMYFKKPSALKMIPVLLGLTSISQLLIIVFFDYYEVGQYARLASAIQPQVYLFLVLMAWLYIFRGRTHSG